MILRPVDEAGDILPVSSPADLLRGVRAEARLVEDRLNLYAGEWWENDEEGNEILEMLRESRLTEADGETLAAYLTSYILETPGVEGVSGVTFAAGEDRRFRFRCGVLTGDGYTAVAYEI